MTLEDALYRWSIPALWVLWALYWFVASRDVKVTQRVESAVSRWGHMGPLLIAALLFSVRSLPLPWLYERFIPATNAGFFAGVALVAAGLAFAVWARVVLGRNWSGVVTVKQDHELIRRGPYAIVRHPIYTGLLAGFAGSALALGQWRGVIALVIVCVALWRKLRLEECWMAEIFGEYYAQYRREVAALVPFLL
jgi:protein-S-isoprenylcysteine O-methyltransferase Ste14